MTCSLAKAALLLLPLFTLPSASSDTGAWVSDFYINAPDGVVDVMYVHDDALFIGGEFASIGSTLARRVARYDGIEWSALGSGVDGQVNALASFGEDLVAGGSFEEAGASPAANVARWDGSRWHALGDGVDASVYSLVEFNGDLIVGGTFESAGGVAADHVARWDGHAWHAMGDGFQWTVRTLAVYRGELYAGSFAHLTEDDDYRMAFVWRWDGSTWAPVTTAPQYAVPGAGGAEILSLQVIDDLLYAIGDQMWVDDSHWDLCYWDGSGWHNLPRGWNANWWIYEYQFPVALLPYDGGLILGGYFWGPGEGTSHSIAIFDGSSWLPLPGGGLQGIGPLDGSTVSAMAEYRGDIYVAGNFPGVGDLQVPLLARWSDGEWSEVATGGQGIVGRVSAVAFWGDRLVAGGRFTSAGGRAISRVAIFDQGVWEPLGPGLDGPVEALMPYSDGIVAAGGFSRAGDLPVAKVTLWDGSAWHAFGPGLLGGSVYALAVYQGDLIAGGGFNRSGETTLSRVARWDGTAWRPMGVELDGTVRALEVHEGALFAAGDFTGHLACWNGDRWRPTGQGGASRLSSLHSTADGLYAAGGFAAVYHWVGGRSDVIDLPWGRVFCLGSHKGDLIVGGRLHFPDSFRETGLLRWNGSDWSAVDGSPRAEPYAIASSGFDLAVGGTFTSTGEVPAWGVALWEEEVYPMAPLAFTATRLGTTVEIACELMRGAEQLTHLVYRAENGDERILLSEAPLIGQRMYKLIDAAAPLAACDYWIEQVADNGDHLAWFGPAHVASSSELWSFDDVRTAPNPARGAITWTFELPAPVPVRVEVFDLTGRRVATLIQERLGPGVCQVEWDGRLDSGRRLPSGIFWFGLEAGAEVRRGRFVLVR
ncbi:MAG: hypothetical protein KAY32_17355 [Candidatus Eisenbacteria sp.]|nr:hypothetical protein [Candidatus Eisenbacteria bacterium]